ncbi:hypothetical protein [Bradyrhizobium sp.]|uniref:hypothetical protein n=1 Tax=Bradyrhizobium sp. TaxID=376 RepID=UPI003C5B3F1F
MDVAIRTTTWAAAQQESLSRMTAASLSPGELMFATLLGIIDLPFFGATAAIGRPQVFPLNGPQYL